MVYRKTKRKETEGGERRSEKGDARCAKKSDEGGIVGNRTRTMTPRCQSGEGELGGVDGVKGKKGFGMRRGEAKYPRR
jgi:hypothetical protein